MATPTIIREGSRIVKPILSLDKTEARRRVYNLYKLCYRHIPYISKRMHVYETSTRHCSQCLHRDAGAVTLTHWPRLLPKI